jgi:FXSXX-COOH protein
MSQHHGADVEPLMEMPPGKGPGHMEIIAGRPEQHHARESALADVSLVSLADLLAASDNVLAAAVRRAVSEVDRSVQAISGWSSYVDGTESAALDKATDS